MGNCVTQDVNQTPRQVARNRTDNRLREPGCKVLEKNVLYINAGLSIASRKHQTDIGTTSYVSFTDCPVVGGVQEKPGTCETSLTVVASQPSTVTVHQGLSR